MIFRIAAISALLVFSAASSAAAQKPSSPSAPAAEAPSPEATAAGRDFYNAMLLESGLADGLIDMIAGRMMPDLRAGLINSPLYAQLSPRRREAIVAFMETMPDLMDREFTAELNTIGDRVAPRYAALMPADQLQQLAAFMRSPEIRSVIGDMVASYGTSGQVNQSLPDWDDPSIPAFAAFAQTPAGVAFSQQQAAFNRILDEEFAAATARLVPRIQQAILVGACAAMEDECPPHVRNAIRPT